MKRILLSLMLIVLVVGIAVAGCAKPAPSPAPTPAPAPAPPKTLDIGIAVPLTGWAAYIGEDTKAGIEFAMEDQNKKGGVTIGGEKYVLNAIVRDTKAEVPAGRNIAEELVFDKKVKVIAGPFIADSIGIQPITEPNKVIMIAVNPVAGCAPDKPYSFFSCTFALECMACPAAYTQKFYPEKKTVFSMIPQIADAVQWADGVKTICPLYGLNWLGDEGIPMDTKDFMPLIQRALTKKPDIIDTSSAGGSMGPMGVLLVKQLREAGYKGVIWMPVGSPPGVMVETVPKEFLWGIVTADFDPESPVVSQTCRDLYRRYQQKFGKPASDLVPQFYNSVSALFQFLDGQPTMDTTEWVKGFEKYRWQGVWGFENYWVGKPLFGINRVLVRYFWVSEWIDGKLETKWEAPIPYELFVEKE